MKFIQVQMLDHNVSSNWWKKIILHFMKQGDEFEIRCWNEEHKEIKKALSYGCLNQIESDFETSITGVISEQMIKEFMLMPEPIDKTDYNKMTIFFTINFNGKISSEHYGSQIYIFNVAADDVEFFRENTLPYWESFSILIEEQSRY